MSDITHPDPQLDLDHPTKTYYQLVHTLTSRLPPPVADTPEALLARNHAALAQVAAMLPVNAHEAGLATQCVAARAQAEDTMRLIRLHDGDIKVVIKLNAQYVAMSRTSLGAHGHLLRAQAVRHKREQSEAARNADEWTQHIAARWMQQTLDAGPVPAIQAAGRAAPMPAAGQATPMPGVVQAAPIAAAEGPPASAPQRAPVAHPPASASEPAPVAHPSEPAPEPAPVAHPPASASERAPIAHPPASLADPAPAAEERPPPAAPMPAPAPQRSRHIATPAELDEPPRNLPTEADHYALVYPRRAQEMRHHGGLPPDCSYGPPDDDLVRAIVTGSSPTLRALDRMGTAGV
jgi:hypothetical protein